MPFLRSTFVRLTLAVALLPAVPARAILLYGRDNSENQGPPPATSPAAGVPWDHAAHFAEVSGGDNKGSCVYLGNNFFLTAHHVGLYPWVVVGGVSYPVDVPWGLRQLGTADAHVFRSLTPPLLSAVEIYTGSNDVGKLAVITGWGLGRDPSTPVRSGSVLWGQPETSALRWGTNVIKGRGTLSTISGESYEALYFYLGNDAGDDEAALTAGDSGSPAWVTSSGVWKLAGICTGVKNPYTALFLAETSPEAANHYNAMVRLRTYQAEYAAATAVRTLTVSATQPAGGAVSPAGTSTWPLSYAVPVSATPQDGWRFTGWTGSGAVFANASSASTTVTLDQNLSVAASFENLAADADGDGIPNLLAHAFAISELPTASSGLPRSGVEPGPDSTPRLTLTYRARTDDPGLSYAVETSTNLALWMDAGSQVETVSTTTVSPGVEERTIRTTTSVGTAGEALYLRLRVAYAP